MAIVDVLLSRWDSFLINRQVFWTGRLTPAPKATVLRLAEPKEPGAVPLFGSSPGEFGLDWASYKIPEVRGPGASPLQKELKDVDEDIEKWKGPNLEIPSMVPHGRALNYGRGTDQESIHSFSGTMDEKWDGQIRNTPKQDFQAIRSRRELQPSDQHEADLKNYGYDFY